MNLAFHIDTRYCSGCKSCQLACKDYNGLPTGQLWRRVYEVSSGSWQARGPAWLHTVTAYNVSISCNHCKKCICEEICPTKAYRRDENGIVWIDQNRCMGCQYCAMACPYNAPQFNPIKGRMGKCDFCRDRLKENLEPICVQACPMRVISWGDKDDLLQRFGPGSNLFPLPPSEPTEPSLIVEPHPSALKGDDPAGLLSNSEEV